MIKYSHIIFDLDGTLINPEAGILESLQYATEQMNIPFNVDTQFLGFIGPPLHIGFKTVLGLSDNEADEAVRLFRKKYGETGLYRSTLYPGIMQMLQDMNKSGCRLYLATSKYEIYAKQILEHLRIGSFFNYVSGASYKGKGAGKKELIQRVLNKIPAREYKECVMIGDTQFDIEGANEAGIDSISVLYGYGTEEVLREAGATVIVESVEALGRRLAVSR